VQFLFDDHVLDVERRELRRAGERIAMEPQVFDLLVHLVRNRDRVLSKDDLIEAIWDGRVVSESTLTSRINAVRKAVGDSGKAQRLIRTVQRKGIRFIGEVSEAFAPREAAVAAKAEPPQAPALRHEIQFCTYDARGNGLSDWEVDDISFEAFARDLESVVEATGIDRFALLGISQGCAVSIAYAVRHPQRVSHLVLYGGFARGRRKRGSPEEVEQADALLTLMRQGWGQENPAFRQIFTSLFIPGATAEQGQWFNDLQQKTTSPANAVRIRRAVDDIDVIDLLPRVTVPTLVLHCRSDAVQPFEEGRTLAAGIRGARFVALEGHNHMILEGDPGWRRFLDEVKTFLRR
jgi:DNA-binding winged helix-turn-helix (wHTH) protein/alpha-beta hydrolase superfamily lysophospholipase